MLKVTDAVREILKSSEVALSAYNEGYLNLSAYAASIHSEVEKRVRKTVQVGTIVVALSRMSNSLESEGPLLPKLKLDSISVKTGLIELAFDKSKLNRDRLQKLYQDPDFIDCDYFAVTHGIGELSIVVPEALKKNLLKIFAKQTPKLVLENLASLTVKFNDKCIFTPNVTYSIIRMLALKRINILETISTFTELTFILDQKDLQEAFAILSNSLRR